eukprot:gb/GFBE01030232.1/.p1 GENE.gb/GFBE01030232.1/~~gb/GFBE01030232.1/.p1  ORF type:complete len:419 (+),score=90.81 gb/GFBE01030232.1/:1-1257(+)
MAPGARLWEVVGGEGRGGILVRAGSSLTSPQEHQRLATGAVIKELDLVDSRLHYELESGTGPASGWVSLHLHDKELVVPLDNADLKELKLKKKLEELEAVEREQKGLPTPEKQEFVKPRASWKYFSQQQKKLAEQSKPAEIAAETQRSGPFSWQQKRLAGQNKLAEEVVATKGGEPRPPVSLEKARECAAEGHRLDGGYGAPPAAAPQQRTSKEGPAPAPKSADEQKSALKSGFLLQSSDKKPQRRRQEPSPAPKPQTVVAKQPSSVSKAPQLTPAELRQLIEAQQMMQIDPHGAPNMDPKLMLKLQGMDEAELMRQMQSLGHTQLAQMGMTEDQINGKGPGPGCLVMDGSCSMEEAIDQMYGLSRSGPEPAWKSAPDKKPGYKGVPLPRCCIPTTLRDSDIPPDKRLVNIDFVSCTS